MISYSALSMRKHTFCLQRYENVNGVRKTTKYITNEIILYLMKQ